MSAEGQIPVVYVDPKIEERLRRKREKQRVYDRRRREAANTSQSSRSTPSAVTNKDNKVKTEEELNNDPNLAGGALKCHSIVTSRRGSAAGAVGGSLRNGSGTRNQSFSDSFIRDRAIFIESSSSKQSVPTTSSVYYPGHSHTGSDMMLTPQSTSSQIKHRPHGAQSQLNNWASSPTSPHTISPVGAAPVALTPASSAHQHPHDLQHQHFPIPDRGITPLPSGTLPTPDLMASRNMGPNYSYRTLRSKSQSSAHPVGNIQSQIAVSKRNFLASQNRRRNRSQPQVKRFEDETYLNLLAVDLGLEPVDVSSVSDSAVTSDLTEMGFIDPINYHNVWDSATTGSHQNNNQHSPWIVPGAPYEPMDQPPHHIVDPLLPEPITQPFGFESADESFYESLYESAFEDSPPEAHADDNQRSLYRG